MSNSCVVVVTGASTGLGLSIAIQAARQGAKVYATMRNLQKRKALNSAAEQAGVTLNVLALDVENTASVQNAIDSVTSAEGRLDVLIANAGVGYARSTEQASEADIAWVMDVNFMGVVRCVKAVMPTFRQQRSGRVIAISSVGGLVGQPFNEIYCASKFAVEGYIESLASYAGPAFGLHFTAVEHSSPPVRVRTSNWSRDFTHLKTQADPDGKLLQAKVVKEMAGWTGLGND